MAQPSLRPASKSSLRSADLAGARRVAAMAVAIWAFCGPPCAAVEPGGAMVPVAPMKRYTRLDQTASVLVPAGWRVVYGRLVGIRAGGPNGELAMLGIVVPAKDAAASSAASPTSPLAQPYTADLREKGAR